MAKVNRNDPCPCGSGKKYKSCCMLRDRITEARTAAVPQGAALLMNRLYQFAWSPRFAAELAEAFRLYWGGMFVLEGLPTIEPEHLKRMLEWFAFDYAIGSERRHVIDIFLETQTSDLPEDARAVLRAWSTSVIGLFRIVDMDADGYLRVYDPLRKEDLSIYDAAFARNAQRGELVVGRVFAVGDLKQLLPLAMLLPAELEQDLAAYVENAYRLYREEHYQAPWEEFLRRYGSIFHTYLLTPKGETWRPLLGPGTRYPDPVGARDKLREFTVRRMAEQQRKKAAEAEERRRPGRRTSSGLIVPGSNRSEGEGRAAEQAPARPKILIPGRDT
ncbi:MAG: SEC-C metal-binding domain-containing protein [Anaerolineae bacterium]